MWTFDNFPSAKVQDAYGFTPSAAFLSHLQKASARDAGGCSASFISPQGLVMTNHHCVVECVGQLSTTSQDFVQSGFYAKSQGDEKTCPAFEIDQLSQIDDVTAQIQSASAGKTGDAANLAVRAASAKAQDVCGKDPAVRCDIVNLYHGGQYKLYRYHRYTDVRLVFAPEYAVAQFGGDPDNFNFPRFDFDIGVVRVYENGKPAATPDYFKWSANGTKAGDLVFVSGNPGSTSRELTVSQLEYTRDVQLPIVLPLLAELRGILEEFELRGAEQTREANELLFFIENDYKAELGRQRALNDPAFFGAKVEEEKKLRDAVAAKPDLQSAYGSAWDDIAKLQTLHANLAPRVGAFDSVFRGGLSGYAQTLVRAAAERKKANGDRLPEFSDQALVVVEQQLEAPAPIYPDLEQTELTFALQQVREQLGTDDPITKQVLGKESPSELAHRLVAGTKLADPAVRKALFTGGQAAIDASTDPMILYAKALDAAARAATKDFEARVTAPTRAAAERIAKARFAIFGTSIDPDATFTARLSYGSVKGFDNNGTAVPPYTTIGGLFNRATDAPPYKLPASWLAAKPALSLQTPMNFVTTNDIIGGNSGSPSIDKNGDIVGLIFDGNIYSLGGEFGYDATRNRAVSVDSRALLEGLQKVYHADRIVSEIEAARK
ncbi:MAG: S46 family peptidase [Candidatus Eremiobacteraeota bacterium]|nr:S46 family peptidase [Candidatus Eremiobacteraeota bacterium]